MVLLCHVEHELPSLIYARLVLHVLMHSASDSGHCHFVLLIDLVGCS